MLGPALAAHALVLARLGLGEEADRLLDEVVDKPSLLMQLSWMCPLPFVMVERNRADQLLRALESVKRGLWKEAALKVVRGEPLAAAETYERIGSRFVEAWARLAAAEAGHPDATRQAELAQRLFERVGATPFIERCRSLLSASA